MNGKGLLALMLLGSLGGNAWQALKPTEARSPYRLPGDERISIPAPEAHRQFVMKEMRTFVEGIQQIRQGIKEEDPQLIIRAGRRSGVGVEAPEELRRSLPQGFMRMGGPTHRLFEAMADSAAARFDPYVTEDQLAQVLNNCVACHRTYRFDAK